MRERLVQNIVLLVPLFCGEVEGEVAIVNGIKKEAHLLDVATIVAVEANISHHCHEQKHNYYNLINIHKYVVIFSLYMSGNL